MDERSTIEAARSGDIEAFNQLVLQVQDFAYELACRILGDPDAAADVVQDAFLKAYQRLASLRGESFRNWILRIITNACYDELRRQKRRPVQPLIPTTPDLEEIETPEWLVDSSESTEAAVERAELSAALRRSLDELPVDYRSVAVLVDVLEFEYAEAARILDVPIGTVKSRLTRARLQLRRKLLDMPDLLSPSLTNTLLSLAA